MYRARNQIENLQLNCVDDFINECNTNQYFPWDKYKILARFLKIVETMNMQIDQSETEKLIKFITKGRNSIISTSDRIDRCRLIKYCDMSEKMVTLFLDSFNDHYLNILPDILDAFIKKGYQFTEKQRKMIINMGIIGNIDIAMNDEEKDRCLTTMISKYYNINKNDYFPIIKGFIQKHNPIIEERHYFAHYFLYRSYHAYHGNGNDKLNFLKLLIDNNMKMTPTIINDIMYTNFIDREVITDAIEVLFASGQFNSIECIKFCEQTLLDNIIYLLTLSIKYQFKPDLTIYDKMLIPSGSISNINYSIRYKFVLNETDRDKLYEALEMTKQYPYTYNTLITSCKNGDYVLFKRVIKVITEIDNKVFDAAVNGGNHHIVNELLNMKAIPSIESVRNITSQQTLDTLIMNGLYVTKEILEIATKKKLYINDLEKYNLEYDRDLYRLCVMNDYMPEIYINKFKANINLHYDLYHNIERPLLLTGKIIEKIKIADYADDIMYDLAAKRGRYDLLEYLEKEWGCKPNMNTCIWIADTNYRRHYYNRIIEEAERNNTTPLLNTIEFIKVKEKNNNKAEAEQKTKKVVVRGRKKKVENNNA